MEFGTGVLVGIGNPLLDLEADVPPEFLKKWKLKENDAVLCSDKLIPMFFDLVDNYKVQFIAGGSTQNSLSVAQWMIGKPHSVTYFGCIGGDHFGHVLRVKAEEVGMNAVYQIRPKEKTGTCATCIVGQSRSLCAHLAAANLFSADYLELQENWKLIEKARYFYVAGFFMSSCLPAIYKIAEHADNAGKYFMMNLSATFICSTMKEHFVRLFPQIDVLFGNTKEFFEIAKALGFESKSLKEVVFCIANIEKASNRSRLVVVTQRTKAGSMFQTYPVPQLADERIVDTSGTGDAFVGVFLSQFIAGKSIEECVDAGIWASQAILQRSGCSLPDLCDYRGISWTVGGRMVVIAAAAAAAAVVPLRLRKLAIEATGGADYVENDAFKWPIMDAVLWPVKSQCQNCRCPIDPLNTDGTNRSGPTVVLISTAVLCLVSVLKVDLTERE
ncbi:Adenosine kinase [Trichinella pseudospiralis]|uniref:Adenosine kinase n=1 Tax=Trichinella pseudospiralis TaxID=6337 RepID=A0A0V1DUW1_TRIPS|nr:Adenosine kinase [Trichinella pseudospiralis]